MQTHDRDSSLVCAMCCHIDSELRVYLAHEATVLLYVDNDGRLTLIGEESPVHGLCYQDHEVLELWQSPPELRVRKGIIRLPHLG